MEPPFVCLDFPNLVKLAHNPHRPLNVYSGFPIPSTRTMIIVMLSLFERLQIGSHLGSDIFSTIGYICLLFSFKSSPPPPTLLETDLLPEDSVTVRAIYSLATGRLI